MRGSLKKLRSNSGETLVEMLVSITLLGISVSIMAAMVATAYRMNDAAGDEDTKFYEELRMAESQTAELESLSTHSVIIRDEAGKEVKIDVKFFGSGEENGLRSYLYMSMQ